MKILQVISSFPPAYSYGGPVKVAYDISKELVKKGHSVDVFTTDVIDNDNRYSPCKNPEYIEGMRVYRFKNISNRLAKKNYPLAPFMFLHFKKIVKEIDIIHLHEYRSFQAVITHFWARYYNIPFILQAHGAVLPNYDKAIFKHLFDLFFGERILRDARKKIAVSNIEKEQYILMGISGDDIEIIPNAIDVSEYAELPMKGIFRKKYGIEDDEKIILYLGRIHKSKGIDFLINSYSELIKSYSKIKLIIAGPNDGYLDNCKKIIYKKQIQNNVIISGPLWREEKKQAFVDANVLVYPCSFEIFGLVPFEALLCGTPVIVSEDCGCGEIIKKANCGLLIHHNNCTDLTEKIYEMIENGANKNSYVINGKNYINSNLNISKIIPKFEMLFEEIINAELND